MNAVVWVSAVASVLGVLVWLAALIWAARQDGRFARAYKKHHEAYQPHKNRR